MNWRNGLIGQVWLAFKAHVWMKLGYRDLAQLGPARLYVLLRELERTRDLPGDIIEIGCAAGGTTYHVARFLKETGDQRRQIAVDTFDGFVPHQFAHDSRLGLASQRREGFRHNSLDFAERYANRAGRPVTFVRGDIVETDITPLTSRLSLALIDVDLEIPTLASIRCCWPLLEPGGVALIDDYQTSGYRAGVQRAVDEFCQAHQPDMSMEYGLAILRKRPDAP